MHKTIYLYLATLAISDTYYLRESITYTIWNDHFISTTSMKVPNLTLKTLWKEHNHENLLALIS